MPYIEKKARKCYDSLIEQLGAELSQSDFNPGHLNYVFTMLILSVWKRFPGYRTIAEVTGVLENIKQEFYRRWAVAYENQKIKENGDLQDPPDLEPKKENKK